MGLWKLQEIRESVDGCRPSSVSTPGEPRALGLPLFSRSLAPCLFLLAPSSREPLPDGTLLSAALLAAASSSDRGELQEPELEVQAGQGSRAAPFLVKNEVSAVKQLS